jgi:Melibiase
VRAVSHHGSLDERRIRRKKCEYELVRTTQERSKSVKVIESNPPPNPRSGHPSAAVLVLVLASVGCASSVFAAEPAYVRAQSTQFVLGNEYLERTITVQHGYPHTSQFENKVSKRTYQITGSEFRLELVWERLNYTAGAENPWKLDASSFKLDGNRIEELPGGTKRLVFNLTNKEREPTLHVQLIYEIRPGEPFTRRWLQLKTEGPGKLFVHYADIETNEWHGSRMRLGGFGQPIYSDDLFWGLEYPTGINRFNGSQVSLGSYVGLDIPADGMATEKTVVGVAESGRVQDAFFSYIDSIRAQPVRPYVLYNTWYDLQGMVMADGNTRQRVHELNNILQDKYKLKLDSFVLDDGWDNMKKLWRIDAARFPNGFTDLSAELKQIGTGLGIWYGPVGGYDDREVRIATGRAQGMEVQSNGDYLCLAGRHYSEYFENSVLDMQKKYDLNFFKLDGIPFGCNEPDHGHPIGIYSREADERVFIDLLTKLRKQKPDIFLNVTTGIWLSPWWLQYADVVWMGGEDSGYLSSLPTLSPRQSALSYRDSILYDDFVRNQLQFPISSIMTHGIIRGKYNLLGGAQESARDWRDELVHYVSVGNMMTELYITPELLNREEWDDLAATLHWAGKSTSVAGQHENGTGRSCTA